MEIILQTKKAAASGDLVAVTLWKSPNNGRFTPTGLAASWDRQRGDLQKTLQQEKFKGKRGETKLISVAGKGNRYLLIVGLGEKNRFESEVVRQVAALAVKAGHKVCAATISIEEFSIPQKRGASTVQLLAEGAILGNYSFDLYKSKENVVPKTVQRVEILTATKNPRLEKDILRGKMIAEATNFARDLINTPASDMTPRRMVEEAKKIGRLPHLSVKVLDREACKKLGMGGFLAVAKGSSEPPYLIHLIYRPSGQGGRPRGRIAIVGKGITFDSGGLSLKTAQGMETMKDDMGGAAAMLGLMRALSGLKPPVEVHGISAVTENMPSGSADKPGDVVRTLTGKTIEILNTDAEGRLTLADAIPYAIRQKPDLVVDIATLTGACVVALGELCAGIMGNDQKIIDRLIASGSEAGEKIWQLPLLEDYREDIKSNVADVKNIGGKGAGTITAGLFIEEFVRPKTPWVHLDIAGPSWTDKDHDLCPKGATGSMVRTLAYFVEKGI